MKLALLGGLTPRDFLRRYWQKRPLFVRGALPGFAGVDRSKRRSRALAARDDVESRIVERRGTRWETAHGPFSESRLSRSSTATLLVNGVNLHVAGADELLQRFGFVPQARLDDVMVSYATPGGGVGPHVDSYDVFLLQGPGRRALARWQTRRLVARAGRPALPAARRAARRRGARALLHLLDRLSRAARRRARRGVPRLAARARPAGRRVPRSRAGAGETRRAECRGEMIAFAQALLDRIRWSRARRRAVSSANT